MFVNYAPIAPTRGRYCGLPHSGQNFAPLGIGLPQLVQNLVSVAGAGAPPPPTGTGATGPAGAGPPPGACGGCGAFGLSAFTTVWPMASPAPSPTPIPATPPPPSLAAAI